MGEVADPLGAIREVEARSPGAASAEEAGRGRRPTRLPELDLAGRPTVIVSNPNGGMMELMHAHDTTIRDLRERGFNVAAFNYRGYGRSSGYPSPDTVESDGAAIARYLIEEEGARRVLSHGTSIGGLVAAGLAARGMVGLMIGDRNFSTLPLSARYMMGAWAQWAMQAVSGWTRSNVPAVSAPSTACPRIMVAAPAGDEVIKYPASLAAGVADQAARAWIAGEGVPMPGPQCHPRGGPMREAGGGPASYLGGPSPPFAAALDGARGETTRRRMRKRRAAAEEASRRLRQSGVRHAVLPSSAQTEWAGPAAGRVGRAVGAATPTTVPGSLAGWRQAALAAQAMPLMDGGLQAGREEDEEDEGGTAAAAAARGQGQGSPAADLLRRETVELLFPGGAPLPRLVGPGNKAPTAPVLVPGGPWGLAAAAQRLHDAVRRLCLSRAHRFLPLHVLAMCGPVSDLRLPRVALFRRRHDPRWISERRAEERARWGTAPRGEAGAAEVVSDPAAAARSGTGAGTSRATARRLRRRDAADSDVSGEAQQHQHEEEEDDD